MTLPSSGSLSMSAIQTEFGGSNPISLSEYYAGGGLVPSGTSGTEGSVPSSGSISINVFHGTSSAPAMSVTADGISDFDAGFGSSGSVTSTTSPNTTPSGGTPGYTYAWTHQSTSSGNTPSISSSTAQNPSWTTLTVFAGTPSTSLWRVTVTDSASHTAYTEITVELTWVDIS